MPDSHPFIPTVSKVDGATGEPLTGDDEWDHAGVEDPTEFDVLRPSVPWDAAKGGEPL